LVGRRGFFSAEVKMDQGWIYPVRQHCVSWIKGNRNYAVAREGLPRFAVGKRIPGEKTGGGEGKH